MPLGDAAAVALQVLHGELLELLDGSNLPLHGAVVCILALLLMLPLLLLLLQEQAVVDAAAANKKKKPAKAPASCADNKDKHDCVKLGSQEGDCAWCEGQYMPASCMSAMAAKYLPETVAKCKLPKEHKKVGLGRQGLCGCNVVQWFCLVHMHMRATVVLICLCCDGVE